MPHAMSGKRSIFIGLNIGGLVTVAAVVTVLLVLIAGGTSPKDVTGTYIAAATNNDIDTLKENSCINDQRFIDDHADSLESFAGSEGENTKVSVKDAKVTANKAKVKATIDKQRYTFDLVREDEVWKVCFDFDNMA